MLEFMQLAMRHGDRFGTNKAYLKLLMPGRNVCHSYAAGLCTRIDRDLANKFCSILIIINMTMAQILRLYSGEINIFVVFTKNKCTAQSKGKRKAVPLQAWTGPEGSRKSRFPDYTKTVQDGGKVVSLRHRPPLPPGNVPGTHFC